jgi:Mrp family chromosome partitioning ATPase
MTEYAKISDTVDAGIDEVAVVGLGVQAKGDEPQEDVVRAIRYLLYRHELTSGTAGLPQMIAVVSASKGEGVTTVSQALAHVLAANRGTRVCWINVGSSEPLPSTFDRQPAALPGIRTTLREVPSHSELGKPDPPGILAVPRGEVRHLSGSATLDGLLDGLAAEYRHVIFDTPPLLSRIDSIGFLRHAEAYILVSKQGSTTTKQIRTVSEELLPIPSLGAILNGYRTRTPGFVQRFFRD